MIRTNVWIISALCTVNSHAMYPWKDISKWTLVVGVLMDGLEVKQHIVRIYISIISAYLILNWAKN